MSTTNSGSGMKTILITVGITGVLGALAYFLFLKKSAPLAAVVPPLQVTGWTNGTFTYKLGTMTGQITPTTQQGVAIKGANAGPYSLVINDYDGSGYDILTLNGTTQNEVYVAGNGSISFMGRPGNNKNFVGRPGNNKH